MPSFAETTELYDNHGKIDLAGSANAYTATVARGVSAYHKGFRICGKANHTNNGAATLNVITQNAPSGMGAKAIRRAGNAALTGGELVSGTYYDFVYDDANDVIQVQNPDIGSGVVTNAMLANMAEATIKGRAAGAGTGAPQDLTAAQARTAIGAVNIAGDTMTGDLLSPVLWSTNQSGPEGGEFRFRVPVSGHSLNGNWVVMDVLGNTFRVFEDSSPFRGLNVDLTRCASGAGTSLTAMVAGTAQATTSGTAFDYTSLPSGIKRITVMFDEVSLSGSDQILVQIGGSGGLETTGYASGAAIITGGSVNQGSSTAGFNIFINSDTRLVSGIMTIARITGNTWVSSWCGGDDLPISYCGGGKKSLSDELDRVRITRSGANTFDAGQVNLVYEGAL